MIFPPFYVSLETTTTTTTTITTTTTTTTTVTIIINIYCLCDLVVRVPGYRCRGPGFDSWRYQIFWEVLGLEQGPLRLVSTIEELLGRKNSGSGLKVREYGRRDPSRWPRDTLYPQTLGVTSQQVMLWQTVSRPVCLGGKPHLGHRTWLLLL
jgi:hypothetical protein